MYKAFDQYELKFVACKIHQIHENWTQSNKDIWLKHTLRENKIHRKLNHPNIVELYDTIEVDNVSFCTVLEYCEG